VVAHVFQKDLRGFYDIEGLWGDAIEVPFKGK
jgi:ribosomal silencing factor RsfS